jgi:Tetratricopeptide repeat
VRAKLNETLSAIGRFSPKLPHYLFAGVFLLRIIALERLSQSPLFLPARGDMHFYNEWAQRILRGEVENHTAFYGLPLYPYLLAFLYRLFGYTPFLPALLQTALDSATAVFIYLLVLRLLAVCNQRHTKSSISQCDPASHAKIFAAAAALGWAVFVPAQAYSIVLMPASWLVFVFWFVVWRILSNPDRLDWKQCLTFGALIGLTAMGIATALFLIPLVLAAVLIQRTTLSGVRIFAFKAAMLLLGVGLGTSPCWIHNYIFAHDRVFLSAHSGVNFWIGNNPTASGYPRFPPGLRPGQAAMLQDSITTAETALGRPLKRAEVSSYWSSKAREYIAAHPGEWIRLLLVKVRNFWSAFQYDDLSIITNLREQGVVLPGLYFGVVAVLGLAGMLLAWRPAPASRWITAAVFLHMLALMPVFITERYRLAVVPGLLVLGAYGLSVFWRNLCVAQYRPAVIYLALVAGAAAFVCWPQRDPALWALDAYNSGWQALESGNLPLAEKKLTLARRYVPTNPETNFAFGNLRLAEGNKSTAASFYLQTLQYDEGHRGALNNLAVIALEEHRYDLAEAWLHRAETIDPRNPKTHYLLASVFLATGNREAAATEIETAIQLRPGQIEFDRLKEKITAQVQ